MTEQEQREAFEVWFVKRWKLTHAPTDQYISCLDKFRNGNYSMPMTHQQWEGWQAALAWSAAQQAQPQLDEQGMFCGACQCWDGKHDDDCSRAQQAQPVDCTEPDRAACPRMCQDFCNKAETERAQPAQQPDDWPTVSMIRAAMDCQDAEPGVGEMVNRFLGWKLPEDFHPDAGISFDRSYAEKWGMPIGTNLFHAGQAKAMFLYCLNGQASPTVDAQQERLERIGKDALIEQLEARNAILEARHEDNCKKLVDAQQEQPCPICEGPMPVIPWCPACEVEAAQQAQPTEAAANPLSVFAEYFSRNYPPDTVIVDPAWHAPRLLQAARFALKAQQAQDAQENILRFGIEVEKMLCTALDRKWSAAGISIESLIDELKANTAQPAQQPNTLGGFLGRCAGEGRNPTQQEIFDAGVKSGINRVDAQQGRDIVPAGLCSVSRSDKPKSVTLSFHTEDQENAYFDLLLDTVMRKAAIAAQGERNG